MTDSACAGNCILILNSAYTESGGQVMFNAQDGVQSVDLTGSGNTVSGGLFQDVATTAGNLYRLSFWVSNQDDNYYPGTETVNLLIDNTTISSYVNPGQTSGMLHWAQFAYDFTASGSTTRIAFTHSSDNNDAGLDNVSLEDVSAPEPGTIATLGSALALLATARLKRGPVSLRTLAHPESQE